jgi:multiple sugar transport system permease protein
MKLRAWRRIGRKLVTYGLIVFSFGILLFPFYWMFISSFENEIYAYTPFHLLPISPSFRNYVELFLVGGGMVLKGLLNSTIIGFGTVGLTLLIAVPAAYAFARYKSRLMYTLFFILWFSSTIPGMVVGIPFYLFSREVGLYDTHLLMIIVYTSFLTPIALWMITPFFEAIPVELEEAALVDGCSRSQVFAKIFLPLALPGLAAMAIYVFIDSWNEFIFGLLLTFTNAKTLTVAMGLLTATRGITDYTYIVTGGIVSLLPPVILAVLFQRYIMKGLIQGALKY